MSSEHPEVPGLQAAIARIVPRAKDRPPHEQAAMTVCVNEGWVVIAAKGHAGRQLVDIFKDRFRGLVANQKQEISWSDAARILTGTHKVMG